MSRKHEKGGQRRWLLLVHQLPANPSNVRVRTWRRLRQLGAVAVKQAAYVLPDSPSAREDFEWLKASIEASSGEASVFAADSVDGRSDAEIVSEFRRTREESYKALARDVEAARRRLSKSRAGSRGRARPWQRQLEELERRLSEIEAIDFFGAPGRDRAVSLIGRLKAELEGGSKAGRRSVPSAGKRTVAPGQLWITRPRPGIDRMASAWLIRRFIDPEARFGFAADTAGLPANAIPFDMFGVELTHRGEGCTFETLLATFGIRDPAVERLAAVVHDLDLKDGRFGPPEAAAVGILVEGLAKLYADDDTLLAQGSVLIEALYRGLQDTPRRRTRG
jgi:hypothetical protein